MRKCLMAVVLAISGLMTPHSANAQAVSQNINLNATVTSYCTINGAASTTPLGPYTVPVSATGTVNTSTINVPAIANVVCNKAANIDTASVLGGVTTGGAPPSGAANVIEYTAVASFGGASSTIDTSASSNGSQGTTTNAATGNLTVSISPQTPSLPLTPGAYSDTLIVTLTPTP
jgi:hypothetical protein